MLTLDHIDNLLTQARRVPADPADPQIRAMLTAVGMGRAQRRAAFQRLLETAAREAATPALQAAAGAAAAEVAAMG